MSRLSDNIKNLRKKRGLSAAQAADYCDISVDEYLAWESGEGQPSEEQLDRLCALLGESKERLKNGKSFTVNMDGFDKKGSYSVDFGANGFNVSSNHDDEPERDRRFSVNMTDDGLKVDFGKKEKNMEEEKRRRRGETWNEFPYPIVCVIAFLLMGFLGGYWHPGWLVFLTIPLYYGLVSAIVNRKATHFPYPVLATIAYLLLGFLGVTWTWSLFIFATIPMYYAMIGRNRHVFGKVIYPIFCIVVYVGLGLFIGSTTQWWAYGWVLFLTIPIIEFFERLYDENHKKR